MKKSITFERKLYFFTLLFANLDNFDEGEKEGEIRFLREYLNFNVLLKQANSLVKQFFRKLSKI